MEQISIHHLPDYSDLEGFHSGIPEIDSFIVTGLKDCIDSHLCIPYVDVAIVTKNSNAFEADTYFPNLEKDPEWKMTAESEEQTYFSLEYTFQKWERIKKF